MWNRDYNVDLTCVRTFATNAARPFPRRSSFTPRVRIPLPASVCSFSAGTRLQSASTAVENCSSTICWSWVVWFLVPAYDFLLRNRVNDRPGPGRSGEPTRSWALRLWARATATDGREPGGAPEAIFLFSAMLCLSSSSMSEYWVRAEH